MENTNIEQIAMILIANSGEARSFSFLGIEHARNGSYDKARLAVEHAKISEPKAHQAQTELLVYESNEHKVDISILLIHAQDHLMTSILARELLTEMIRLYEVKEDREI